MTETQRQSNRDRTRRWKLNHPDEVRLSAKKYREKYRVQIREYHQKRYLRLRSQIRAQHREYYYRDVDATRKRQRISRARQWEKNPEVERAKFRRWYHRNKDYYNQPNIKILGNLRRRLWEVIRGKVQKSQRTTDILGCPISDFLIYLESKFEPDMSWQNYGLGKDKWNVDHIVPCSLFDLTKPDHQKRCFHFSNLQPMWSVDNFSKHDRVISDHQFQLI